MRSQCLDCELVVLGMRGTSLSHLGGAPAHRGAPRCDGCMLNAGAGYTYSAASVARPTPNSDLAVRHRSLNLTRFNTK